MIHHLAVDGVSWRILVPDLAAAWRSAQRGERVSLEAVGTSFRGWARHLAREGGEGKRAGELELWRSMLAGGEALLSRRPLDPRGQLDQKIAVAEPASAVDQPAFHRHANIPRGQVGDLDDRPR